MQCLRPLRHPDPLLLVRALQLPEPAHLSQPPPGTAAGGAVSWEHPCLAPTKGCGLATASSYTRFVPHGTGVPSTGAAHFRHISQSPRHSFRGATKGTVSELRLYARQCPVKGSRHTSTFPVTSSIPSRASGDGKPSTWPAALPHGRFLGQQGCFLLPSSELGRLGKEGCATPTPGGMLCRSQGVRVWERVWRVKAKGQEMCQVQRNEWAPIPVGKRLTYCPRRRGGRRAQISGTCCFREGGRL